MKHLITGSKGQLGFDINRELLKNKENNILCVDYEEMDITDFESVKKVLTEFKPDVVYHCAAWTQVDKAEDEEDKCYLINVTGTKNIATICKSLNCKLIYISTDYVFDGSKDGIYEIDDTINPLSVYGKSKYLGELEAAKIPKHFIVRVSWVFGINGNNFIRTMIKLGKTKDELNIVGDQVGSPTYTVDLAKLLVTMANTDKYGIYHCNNEGFCSWAEFAKFIFEINGNKVKVNSITTEEYPTKAKRPLNSKLSKKSLSDNGFELLPSWKDAVRRYIKELE